MPRQRLQSHVILFLDEWHMPEPAYYLVDEVKGINPKDAIKRNRVHLLKRVRDILSVQKDEIAEYKIERALYVIPIEHWVSASEAYWQVDLATTVEA